ncbi:hypothetical protein AOLI_G00042130 [Acnodon oligacanthus]
MIPNFCRAALAVHERGNKKSLTYSEEEDFCDLHLMARKKQQKEPLSPIPAPQQHLPRPHHPPLVHHDLAGLREVAAHSQQIPLSEQTQCRTVAPRSSSCCSRIYSIVMSSANVSVELTRTLAL